MSLTNKQTFNTTIIFNNPNPHILLMEYIWSLKVLHIQIIFSSWSQLMRQWNSWIESMKCLLTVYLYPSQSVSMLFFKPMWIGIHLLISLNNWLIHTHKQKVISWKLDRDTKIDIFFKHSNAQKFHQHRKILSRWGEKR